MRSLFESAVKERLVTWALWVVPLASCALVLPASHVLHAPTYEQKSCSMCSGKAANSSSYSKACLALTYVNLIGFFFRGSSLSLVRDNQQ